MSNIHQFRAFAHVVRTGSFSGAARALGVSQSALTQHIANLEGLIGASLLIRRRTGVELTATGRAFYEMSDEITRLDTAISEKVRRYADLNAGHLRIIANAPQPALRMIKGFSQLHPEVEIEFALLNWTRAMAALRDREVDVGIVTAPSFSNDLYAREIEQVRYVLYCGCEHRLAGHAQVSLQELEGEVLLLPEKGSLTERVVSAAYAKAGIKRRRVVTTTTFPVMKEALLQGVGVGIFLERSASNETRLAEVPIQELPDPFTTCMVIPRAKLEHRLVQQFSTLS